VTLAVGLGAVDLPIAGSSPAWALYERGSPAAAACYAKRFWREYRAGLNAGFSPAESIFAAQIYAELCV